MYDETCKLIATNRTVNSMGDIIDSQETFRTVFCRVKSYNSKEKYMAESDGEVPELVIVLADKLEYEDEKMLDYKGKKYKVVGVSFDDLHDDIGLVVSRWQIT